jgi:glycosyltransferase involved in cell wall biosynthesis
MALSVVIIGRNAERTLPECIHSIRLFARQNKDVAIEILYVDSASTDSSISVAENALYGFDVTWKIISVQSEDHSAALGRCIGMQIARYTDILFLDSDMFVDAQWLTQAMSMRNYRILSGQRYEVYLDSNTCWIVNRNFYKDIDLGKVSRPGGLFLLFDSDKTKARFTPYLRSEEEADFVAQDEKLISSIYRTPEVAFVHLNRKPAILSPLKRLYGNIRDMPAMSNYICARIHAIQNGYYLRLFKHSRFYEVGAICSLLFYFGLYFGSWMAMVIFSIFVIGSKRRMSICYRAVAFPAELFFAISHFLKHRKKYTLNYSTPSANYTSSG